MAMARLKDVDYNRLFRYGSKLYIKREEVPYGCMCSHFPDSPEKYYRVFISSLAKVRTSEEHLKPVKKSFTVKNSFAELLREQLQDCE